MSSTGTIEMMGVYEKAAAFEEEKMFLVICMAGMNTRFHDVGFDVPKYLLPWRNGSVLDGILEGMDCSNNFSKVILLPNKRDYYFKDELLNVIKQYDLSEKDVCYIPDTPGQAHTAAIGAQILGRSQGFFDVPVAYHNADTIIAGRDFKNIAVELKRRDCFVDIFPASESAYSYVATVGNRVVRIVEKEVISPFASSGFYAFRSASFYLDAFNSLLRTKETGESKELFIAEVIDHLANTGKNVFVNDLNRSIETTVLGTPKEYGIQWAKLAIMSRRGY